MKKSTKFLGILVLIAIGVIAFYGGQRSTQSDVSVKLSKQIYSKGEQVRITVRNNTLEQICFSSCYPYYLQRKDEDWKSYNYPDCPEKNLSIPCITSGETKQFEFTLEESLPSELHRIAIPIDKNGERGEEFGENKKVYSEPFDVK